MSLRRIILLVAAALVATFAHAASAPAPLILISMDGFRWDYCDLYPAETPRLRQLKREGVSARGLIPVFPTNTFPNHYSIVTGLYPAHHGIINNVMFDPRTGEFFRYNTPKSSRETQWWGGEPIWITAVKQGRVSACMYWPGSEAPIDGRQATYWRPFDYYDRTFAQRLDEMTSWFQRPSDERPIVTTFYIEEANGTGHSYGPDSPELAAELKRIDTQIGEIQAGFARENIAPNLVLVSDHGMTSVGPQRLLILDDFIDLATVQLEDTGSAVSLRPLDGNLAALERALAKIPHAKIHRADNLPAHFRLKNHPRISPLWILPELGWRIDTRANAAKPRKSGRPLGGDHGYDPALSDMHGVFIAHGPAFKSGVALAPVENIHIYNLLCAALGLKPAPNDGDDRLVKAALRN